MPPSSSSSLFFTCMLLSCSSWTLISRLPPDCYCPTAVAVLQPTYRRHWTAVLSPYCCHPPGVIFVLLFVDTNLLMMTCLSVYPIGRPRPKCLLLCMCLFTCRLPAAWHRLLLSCYCTAVSLLLSSLLLLPLVLLLSLLLLPLSLSVLLSAYCCCHCYCYHWYCYYHCYC